VPAGFGVIWTTVALDLVGFGMILPVLARYAEDLGASATEAGLLVASFSVAQLLCSPLSGRLSDRVGRKPVLIMSLVGTAVGSLLTGLAGSLWLLFLARILDGASGASVSVAQAAVTDVAEPADRARLLGLLGAAFGVGFSMGPAIGGLAALVDHRLPFFVAAAIAAVNAAVAVRRLPETHPSRSRSPQVRAPAAERLPTQPPAASTSLRRLVLVVFVAMAAFSGFEATFSLLADVRYELSESATYGVFFVIGLALVVVQGGLVGTVHERLGESATLRAGLAANALGLALLAVDAGWPGLVPALALLVMGQGLVAPTLAAAVAGRARADRRGMALGIQQSAGGLARVVGPAGAGALFDHVGVATPFVVAAVLAAVAVALVPSTRSSTGQELPAGGEGLNVSA
jgi:multidrug resistance protein